MKLADVFRGQGCDGAHVARAVELRCARLVLRHSHKAIDPIARGRLSADIRLVWDTLRGTNREGWHMIQVSGRAEPLWTVQAKGHGCVPCQMRQLASLDLLSQGSVHAVADASAPDGRVSV